MPLSRNIGRHLNTVGQSNPCNLSHSRVWLFRIGGKNPGADTPLQRTVFKRRRLALHLELLSTKSNQLIYCRQKNLLKIFSDFFKVGKMKKNPTNAYIYHKTVLSSIFWNYFGVIGLEKPGI
jgi:hypothetical protein